MRGNNRGHRVAIDAFLHRSPVTRSVIGEGGPPDGRNRRIAAWRRGRTGAAAPVGLPTAASCAAGDRAPPFCRAPPTLIGYCTLGFAALMAVSSRVLTALSAAYCGASVPITDGGKGLVYGSREEEEGGDAGAIGQCSSLLAGDVEDACRLVHTAIQPTLGRIIGVSPYTTSAS